jgi:DNA modification methylase
MMMQMSRNSCRSGYVVCGSFCGVGSTTVMASRLNRIGFGCEIDPGYVAVELSSLGLKPLKPELWRCQ